MKNKQLNIPNTMVQKHFYEAPESELLLVKFEGNFCATGDGTWDGSLPGGTTWNPNIPSDGYGLE